MNPHAKLAPITQNSPPDPLNIGARLDELRLVKDNWLDGSGKAPSKEGLDWLEEAFHSHYPSEVAPPRLYPTPEGNISAEWLNKKFDISLDINLSEKKAEWYAYDLQTKNDEAGTLNLAHSEDWKWLVSTIREKTT